MKKEWADSFVRVFASFRNSGPLQNQVTQIKIGLPAICKYRAGGSGLRLSCTNRTDAAVINTHTLSTRARSYGFFFWEGGGAGWRDDKIFSFLRDLGHCVLLPHFRRLCFRLRVCLRYLHTVQSLWTRGGQSGGVTDLTGSTSMSTAIVAAPVHAP